MLEDGQKRYFGRRQVGKRTYTIFIGVGHHQSALTRPYMDRGRELRNEGKPWNGKLIRKLLLTVTVGDLERFTLKDKPVTSTGAFVELYNWRKPRQVHEIHRIIELEKMRASTVENSCNLNAHYIIEI